MFRFALFACVSAGSLMAMGLLPAPKLETLSEIALPDIRVPDEPARLAGLADFSFALPAVSRFEDAETPRPKPRPIAEAGMYMTVTVPSEPDVTDVRAVMKTAELAVVPQSKLAAPDSAPLRPFNALVRKVTALVRPDQDQPPSIVASTVTFGFDEAVLDDEAMSLLGAFAAQVQANPDIQISISGHTDRIGSEDYNDALGMRRADQVARYLLASGVPQDRIKVIRSHGERFPAVEADDRSRANRRVLAEVWN